MGLYFSRIRDHTSDCGKRCHLDDDAAQQAPHDVAAPHVAGQHAVRQQVHHLRITGPSGDAFLGFGV